MHFGVVFGGMFIALWDVSMRSGGVGVGGGGGSGLGREQRLKRRASDVLVHEGERKYEYVATTAFLSALMFLIKDRKLLFDGGDGGTRPSNR